jgi:hypothetical protein
MPYFQLLHASRIWASSLDKMWGFIPRKVIASVLSKAYFCHFSLVCPVHKISLFEIGYTEIKVVKRHAVKLHANNQVCVLCSLSQAN